MTIQELFEKFLEYKKPVCKVSTLGGYRMRFQKLCRTVLHPDMDVEDFDKSTLLQVYNDCKAGGATEKTCRDTVTLLKNIFSAGVAMGVCKERLLQVQYERDGCGQKAILKVYDKTELQKILSWMELNPHFWTLGVYIAIYTGARIGEICGLRWEDIDFSEKTIHVQRTVERTATLAGKGTSIYINTTKTHSSNRLLPLSGFLEKRLRDWSRVSRPEFYVVSNSLSPIEPRMLRDRFVRLCALLKVRYKGFHSLRHTFATMMLENGTDIKTISDILGHSSVEITMDVYSHPSNGSKLKAVNKTFRNLKFE